MMHTAVQKSHIHKITINRGKEVHLRVGAETLTHARAFDSIVNVRRRI